MGHSDEILVHNQCLVEFSRSEISPMFIFIRWTMVYLSAVLAVTIFLMTSTMYGWNSVALVELLVYPVMIVLFWDLLIYSAAYVKISYYFTQVLSISGILIQNLR